MWLRGRVAPGKPSPQRGSRLTRHEERAAVRRGQLQGRPEAPAAPHCTGVTWAWLCHKLCHVTWFLGGCFSRPPARTCSRSSHPRVLTPAPCTPTRALSWHLASSLLLPHTLGKLRAPWRPPPCATPAARTPHRTTPVWSCPFPVGGNKPFSVRRNKLGFVQKNLAACERSRAATDRSPAGTKPQAAHPRLSLGARSKGVSRPTHLPPSSLKHRHVTSVPGLASQAYLTAQRHPPHLSDADFQKLIDLIF